MWVPCAGPIKGELQRDAFVGFKPPRLTTVLGISVHNGNGIGVVLARVILPPLRRFPVLHASRAICRHQQVRIVLRFDIVIGL